MAGTPVIIVLASGRSERFFATGGTTSKLQTMLCGITVLERVLAAVRASGLPYHLEDGGYPGMGDSIAAGVRATAGAQSWLILPGDLPLIQASTLRLIAAAPAALNVVVPVVDGKRGHPVRFSAQCGADLMRLTGAQGAAAVVRSSGATEWLVEDIGCIFDIDTVDDLRQAQKILQE